MADYPDVFRALGEGMASLDDLASFSDADVAVSLPQPRSVPAAFVSCDAQQCGFCTAGFVVAMKAVLEANPRATPAQVEKGLAGNICRCGTYEQMRHAIEQLCKVGAEPKEE